MSRLGPRRAFGVVILASALVLSSCGSSGGSAASSGDGTPGPSSVLGTTATTVAAKLFADDFTSVCQGAGMSRAREYVAAGTHKALYFETFTDSLLDQSTELPDDWTVQFDANANVYASIDIVACGVRTSSTFIKDCTGYQDDAGKDTGNIVKIYAATYEVTVHQATSGKTLGSTTLKGSDDICPSFQSFDAGEKTVKSYDSPLKDELIAFLKPFVQP